MSRQFIGGDNYEPNAIHVGPGESVQAAIDAAAVRFAATGVEQIVNDYSSKPYAAGVGVTVVRMAGKICSPASTVTRPHQTSRALAVGENGLGSETQWPAVATCNGLQWAFANINADEYLKKGNSIYVYATASVDAGTTWIPLKFDGKPCVEIGYHSLVFSDALNVTAVTGAENAPRVRCYATVGDATDVIPVLAIRANDSLPVDFAADKFHALDYTFADGDVYGDDGGITTGSYTPLAMYGIFATKPITIAAIGDSELAVRITSGDATTSILGMLAKGRTDIAIHSVSYPGAKINQCNFSAVLDAMQGCPVVIVEYGINNAEDRSKLNISTDAELTRLKPIWAELKRRGCKVYQTSILPNTKLTSSSLANFETTGQAEMYTGSGQLIANLNAYIAQAASDGLIDGCIDWSTCVSVVNGGISKWKTGAVDVSAVVQNTQLVHPSPSGVQLMANAIAISVGHDIFAITPPSPYIPTPCFALVKNKDTVIDDSGNSTPVAKTGTFPPVAPAGSVARITHAIGGADGFVKIGDAAKKMVNAGENFTITAWINLSVNNGFLFTGQVTVAGSNITMHMSVSATRVYVYTYNDGGELIADLSRPAFSLNNWHCMGLSVNQETSGTRRVSLIVDANEGNSWDNQLFTSQGSGFAFEQIFIGNSAMVGKLGEVVFLKREISRGEFLQYYNATKAEYGL